MTTFPPGFFDRADESADVEFYLVDRLVAHLDETAVAAVTDLYRELELAGDVLDLCSSWISHFETAPEHLVAIGMNVNELHANPALSEYLVQDLNLDPILPFPDASFDAVTCCVSVDYLTRPIEVFAEAARVLRPGAPFVVTFSNRCFPTKAIRGWLGTDDRGRCTIVAIYFDQAGGFDEPTVQLRDPSTTGDPLYAVWARRSADDSDRSPSPSSSAPDRMADRFGIRAATVAEQPFISEMQYEALFVAPGDDPFPATILDEPKIRKYHVGFGSREGDVGVIAETPDGRLLGAAWVRLVEGYGFVDAETPELGIAVVPSERGVGVGTELLTELLDVVPRCSLSVDTRNAALRLYERVGFATVRSDGEHTAIMLREGIRS